ncbi:MAG: FAD-dependent oxidoreductase [Candidatus Colwellbacteria bacterium]|nr:FAD-dependent oxidoreductase [Candidatus Colwellbacteria bacterium]
MYDIVILGGGPAAVSAGIYAARKKMSSAIIADNLAGQSIVSDDINNWIGIKSISGFALAKSMEDHLRAYDGIDIFDGELVTKVERIEGGFVALTPSEKRFEAKTVLVATGGSHRKLGIPGEEKFEGKGVVFCSTCDAPLFKGKDVAVIGGGNAGLEAVLDLVPYASKIYLLVRSEKIRGDLATLDKVKASEKVEILYNTVANEVLGDVMVSGLKVTDSISGIEREMPVSGVFVEIGTVPNSDMVKGLVELDEKGEIKIDCRTGRSSLVGIWAAGDVSDALYKQNNLAAGDGIKATLNAYDYIRNGI